MLRSFHVPSGIGDVSWLYSKLMHVEPANWIIADGWPHRTAPFLKLLPRVIDAVYGPFNYHEILKQEEYHSIQPTTTWAQVEALRHTNVYIEVNRHLEAGRRLEDWMPDLPTEFHYHIDVPAEDALRAHKLLEGLERPIWGISAASYRGSEAWKTWGYDNWSWFLKEWEFTYGGTILLMGGFWDDLTHTLVADNPKYKDIVGKTSVGSMLEILKTIDGYIGFSSGMGILRTVFDKPVFMLWPDHQVELSTSWAPKHMLESDRYVASLWREPRQVIQRAKLWHKASYA